MIKIYGPPKSSASRCYWALEELGLKYERQPLDMKLREHKSDSYLALNPNGKVPCLVDGDFVIWESMAINNYLCEKYQSDLAGKTPEERGHILQWSYWSSMELQKPLVEILIQVMFVPEEKRDTALIERAKKSLSPILGVLDRALEGKEYLVANRFTLADLHAASIANLNRMLNDNTTDFKNVSEWLDRCTSRPAHRRLMELDTAPARV